VKLVDKLLKRLLKFGRTSQLKQHVHQSKVFGDCSAVILSASFWAGVAVKTYALVFVDALLDERTGRLAAANWGPTDWNDTNRNAAEQTASRRLRIDLVPQKSISRTKNQKQTPPGMLAQHLA
jgi:hypothetical protein